jgi:two-component system sensor kinase FixL
MDLGPSDSPPADKPSQITEDAATLSAILDTAAEGIITIDEHGIVESINPAGLEMFGYAQSEVLGNNVSMLMPQHYRVHHDGYMANYLRTGQAKIIGTGREVEGQRKDGSVFPMGLAVSDVAFADRRLFAGIVRDLSARRQAESEARGRLHELAHASRLLELGEMTSGLSHEINQPLTAIVTFAQACQRLVAANSADPEMLENTLGQIVQQGERAAQIVKSLRDFSRKHDGDYETVSLPAVAQDVLALLQHEIHRSGVNVTLDAAGSHRMVNASRIQIEQVLVNLIRNAIEAMQSIERGKRSLHVTVASKENGLEQIVVDDTGKGIPTASMDKLFDAYFTTKSDGMGVGLSISRSIAQTHGGQLTAYNLPFGGARFTIELPCVEEPNDGVS